jgi:16S rRNA (adenine1518-N6/adenine1519-N6)-dimethyltransferase
MNLSELIPFLKSVDARPRKHLSQNFLVDPKIINKIIQMAEVEPGEEVLEIGPGPGALTAALLERGAYVYAIEMDPIFARELARFDNGRLRVSQCDFLKFPMKTLPNQIKVVANLPYHITTPIIEKLFASSFSSITIMVQKEVADRMIATAGSKEIGSLSHFVQFYSRIHSSMLVPPSSFYPQPKVDSTVVRLDYRNPPEVDSNQFFNLMHQAFQKRRKMLTSSLPFPRDRIQNALIDLGIRTDARPEVISLDQWVELTKKLSEPFP